LALDKLYDFNIQYNTYKEGKPVERGRRKAIVLKPDTTLFTWLVIYCLCNAFGLQIPRGVFL